MMKQFGEDTRFPWMSNDASEAVDIRPDSPVDQSPSSEVFSIGVDANITVVGGPYDGAVHPVRAHGLRMGRLSVNDIVINEPWVSRRHAEVFRSGPRYFLRDLESSNGTFVADFDIGDSAHELRDGDRIRFGDSSITLLFRETGPATMKVRGSALRKSRKPVAETEEAQQHTQYDSEPVPWRTDTSQFSRKTGVQDVGLCEGEAMLHIQSGDNHQNLLTFLNQLRRNPKLRVLRLVALPSGDTEVTVGLREQIRLQDVLESIDCVDRVTQFEPTVSGASAFGVFLGSHVPKSIVVPAV